ncbi:MAG: leucyl aminopeptidase [Actinomycetales bacterium]|nr:leucyl aminopeptidase [Actinomycetales bacterium]
MTTLRLVGPKDIEADVLIIGTRPGSRKGTVELADAVAAIPAAAKRKLIDALTAAGATGKVGDCVSFLGSAAGLKHAQVFGIGLGDTETNTPGRYDAIRDGVAVAVRAAAGNKKAVVAVPICSPDATIAAGVGAKLGAYQFTNFKTTPPKKAGVKQVGIIVPDPKHAGAKEALTQAAVVADAVCFARDLINTPASHLHPADLAEAAVTRASSLGITCEVLDEHQLSEGGYGGLMGVGQGAADGPRLARLAYRPKGAKTHVVLVGKGITFDTGGYSMKPATSMLGMQADMSGAAAVAATICAAAELGINVNVTAYMTIAENMVSSTATRPTDVITIYGGKTVEVNNTDAEGRLVMADGLARSAEDKPDIVIDVATLTGAMVLSLGQRTAGFFATHDDLADAVVAASKASGEPFWRMPILEHLRPSLDSNVADISNVGERMGGAISATLFLREFVPAGVKWAHLDIAGPAFNESAPYGINGKGGAGFAVRTLLNFLDATSRG